MRMLLLFLRVYPPLTGKAGASWTRTGKIASRPKGESPLLALGSATSGGRPAGEAQSPQQRGQSGREWAVRGSQEEDAESWDQLGCLKPSLARCSDHPSSNLVEPRMWKRRDIVQNAAGQTAVAFTCGLINED